MIKPLNNYILVEELKEETILIEYAKSGKKSFSKGKVVAVSDNVKSIKEGNIVLFSSYSLENIDGNGFVRENDVLAVYE